MSLVRLKELKAALNDGAIVRFEQKDQSHVVIYPGGTTYLPLDGRTYQAFLSWALNNDEFIKTEPSGTQASGDLVIEWRLRK